MATVPAWAGAFGSWLTKCAAIIGFASGVVGVVGLAITWFAYRDAREQSRAAETAGAELRQETARLRWMQEVTLSALQNKGVITGIRRDADERTIGLDATVTLAPLAATASIDAVGASTSGPARPRGR